MNVRTFIKRTATATAFAAALILGGCASTDDNGTMASQDDFGHVGQEGSPEAASNAGVIPGPAKVDSDGNVYTSSAAPGKGNPSGVGTNTNVNVIPQKAEGSSSVTYQDTTTSTLVTTTPVETTTTVTTPVTTVDTTTVDTTADTTARIETTTTESVPMTSSATTQETTTTTEETTTTRTRMRKD